MRTSPPSTTSEQRGAGSPVGPAAVVVLVVWLLWAWLSGGYAPERWGSIGLVLVALAALCLALVPTGMLRNDRLRVLALSALAAFVGWSFLSILWADFPGNAWVGSDKTFLYALCFVLFACWSWTPRAAVAVLGAYSLAVGAIAAVVLVRAATSAHPASFFLESRLLDPIGYANGSVALWMSAFWPAVYLGSTRALPVVRPLALAAGTLLLETSVLGQTRAWLFVLPIVSLAAIAVARQRLRIFVGLAICGGLTAVAAPSLLDVFDKANAGEPIAAPLDRAASIVLVTSLVACAVGVVWALIDLRVVLPRRIHLVAGALAALAVVAAVVIGVARADAFRAHPIGWTQQHWHEFTTDKPVSEKASPSRFTAYLGGDRYQEWTIAWHEFTAHPLLGDGVNNYEAPYLLHRSNALHEPLYSHSLVMELLAVVGLPGTLFFAVFVAAAVALALRCRNRLDAVGGGAVAAALTAFLYFLLHASVDWFWELPALAAPALGLLGLAGAVRPAPPVSRPSRNRWAKPVAAGLAAIVAAAAIGLQWFAASYENAAASGWRKDRATAFRRLDRAASLDRLSAEPYVLAGSIALRAGDLARAGSAFRQAIAREPDNWYAHLQLGLVEGSAGRYDQAALALRRARRLNPHDPVVAVAQRLVRERKPIDARALNDRYLVEVNRRLGRHVFPTH
jgi:hypothetical protein